MGVTQLETTVAVEQPERPGSAQSGVSVAIARPSRSWATAILAHGAGGSMQTASIVDTQQRLADTGVIGIRFNFLYRERGKKVPDRAPLLEATWRSVANWARKSYRPRRLFLGGRSMGGRVASHIVASGYECDGLFFLAYPLHPPGKPDRLRKDHLFAIDVPMLFVSGTRDTFAQVELLEDVVSSLNRSNNKHTNQALLHWIEGADHAHRVTKSTGRTATDVSAEIVQQLTAFMKV